ncbi:hypothetical protein [Komagataeibacter medellinensis]|uniref:Uncharacterized protein n=1 Tax=Komagataeibacter medellinensis (strain NBRC 3288 / BCRC 11682 / LMG 1693 / Kondo 51) TaxID=634177 RepID=G2I751_KOMMN|nr:hypothetical protein [Komagataeibacter medellinensis]BAK83948.1 hypothetical protein GLX_15360 [Komagataeibacter medellinensis NBRC 3288]
MNKNQDAGECTMGRAVPVQERIRNAESLIAKGRADLALAKVKELNEKLQEVQWLRRRSDCPPTTYIITGDGVALVRVSEDSTVCGFEHVELARRNEIG